MKTLSLKRIETVLRDGKPGEPKEGPQQLIVFDEQGHSVREDLRHPDGTLWDSRIRTYDANGRNLKDSLYDEAGKLMWERTFQYEFDTQGRLSTTSIYDDAGKLDQKMIRNYNDRGLLADSTTYNRDGTVANKSVYTYDERGGIAEFAVYNSAGFLWQKQIPTSAGNDMIISNDDGSLKRREVRGAPVKEEFDAHGSWTRQTTRKVVTESGKTQEMVEVMVRTIVYY